MIQIYSADCIDGGNESLDTLRVLRPETRVSRFKMCLCVVCVIMHVRSEPTLNRTVSRGEMILQHLYGPVPLALSRPEAPLYSCATMKTQGAVMSGTCTHCTVHTTVALYCCSTCLS